MLVHPRVTSALSSRLFPSAPHHFPQLTPLQASTAIFAGEIVLLSDLRHHQDTVGWCSVWEWTSNETSQTSLNRDNPWTSLEPHGGSSFAGSKCATTITTAMANLYHLLLVAGDLWIWLPHHIPHRPHKVAGLLWSLCCCIIPLMTTAKVEKPALYPILFISHDIPIKCLVYTGIPQQLCSAIPVLIPLFYHFTLYAHYASAINISPFYSSPFSRSPQGRKQINDIMVV